MTTETIQSALISALAGTNGTPSDTNRYITDSDPRVGAAAGIFTVAPRYIRAQGTATSAVAGTTVPVTTTATTDNTDSLFAIVASIGGPSQILSSVADPGGAWTVEATHSNGAGPSIGIARKYFASGLISGSVVTPTLLGSSAKKGAMLAEFAGLTNAVATGVSIGGESSSTLAIHTGPAVNAQTTNQAIALAVFAVSDTVLDSEWTLTDSTWTKLVPVTAGAGPPVTLLAAWQAIDAGTITPVGTITRAAAYSGVCIILQANPLSPTIPVGDLLGATVDGSRPVSRSQKVSWVASAVKRPEDFGANGDAQTYTTAAVSLSTPTVVTLAAYAVSTADVGKKYIFEGAGAAGAPLTGTITAKLSATTMQMNTAASTAVTSGNFHWATDDSAAFEAAMTKIPQPSGAFAGPIGGTLLLEGGGYGIGANPGILIGSNGVRQSMRILGMGSTSSIEGGFHGTTLLALTPGMTVIKDDGGASTPDLYGCQVERLSIYDACGGGVVGIDLIRTNRCRIDGVTCRGKFGLKDMIGLRLDAQNFDCSWNIFNEYRAIYCDKGIHQLNGFGSYWASGEAEQCNFGYYGEKDRHMVIGPIEMDYIGAIGVYSKGAFLTIQAGCHLETANSTAASTAVHIVPGANTPIDGCGLQICGATFLAQNGASQYGVVIESGASAGRIEFYTRSILSANRVVNNTGSSLASWRGSVVDSVSGTLDVNTIS